MRVSLSSTGKDQCKIRIQIGCNNDKGKYNSLNLIFTNWLEELKFDSHFVSLILMPLPEPL